MSATSIDRELSPTIQIDDTGGKDGGNEQGSSQADAGPQGKPSKPGPSKASSMSFPIDQDLFGSHAPGQSDPLLPLPSHSNPPEPADDYPEPETEEALLHPPDFRPFFTLVSDPETGEHHHPTVHYLFSDDDQEILTAAALRSIDAAGTDVEDGVDHKGAGQEVTEENGEVDERVVILDIAADGKRITNVASLSKEWQALRTEVGAAPSMGDAPTSDQGESGKGLMLKVSGVEAGRQSEVRARTEDLEGLMRRFGQVLEGLDGVVGKADAEMGREDNIVEDDGDRA